MTPSVDVQLLWGRAAGLSSPSLAALVTRTGVAQSSAGQLVLCFSVPLPEGTLLSGSQGWAGSGGSSSKGLPSRGRALLEEAEVQLQVQQQGLSARQRQLLQAAAQDMGSWLVRDPADGGFHWDFCCCVER